jgi:hypothetical protein
MEFSVQNKSVYFSGQFKDLLEILSGYPPNTTLSEFIKLHLN